MLFEVTRFRGSLPTDMRRPIVCLARDHWNDFGYQTLFYATLYTASPGDAQPLGNVKILRQGQLAMFEHTADEFPVSPFENLDSTFVSLWQTPESYEIISRLSEAMASDLLQSLCDAAIDPKRIEAFQDDLGFRTSLLRFSEAKLALKRGQALFAPKAMSDLVQTPEERRHIAFKYQFPATGGNQEISTIDFEFDGNHPLGRIFVLVGANGTGKTRLLADVAAILSGMDLRETAGTIPSHPPFGVIAASYSAFDRFTRPHRRVSDYRYCGLREDADNKDAGLHRIDVDGRLDELAHALANATPSVWSMLHDLLRRLGLPEERLDPIFGDGELKDFVKQVCTWSAGYQMVTLVLANLLLWTKANSLILFDEPELYLHPTLLSSLLRALHDLLVERDAYCILATHSPIPVQEVPARFIRILEQAGSQRLITRPSEQTFGADLSEIVGNVFRLGPEDRNYLSAIEEWLQKCEDPDMVSRALDGNLSLAVRVLLHAHRKGGSS